MIEDALRTLAERSMQTFKKEKDEKKKEKLQVKVFHDDGFGL